jgi:O-antigen/teichoic acid export membrane protein
VGRAAWVLSDQAVSALGNAALSLAVAHAVSSIEFGAFALAFSTYAFAIGISQALAAQVVVIRFSSGCSLAEQRRAINQAAALTLTIASVMSGCLLVAAEALHPPVREALIGIALFLPALLIQDLWRTVLIAVGRPAAAFLNDLLWSILALGLAGALVSAERRSAIPYLMAWGGCALVVAVYGVRQVGGWPDWRGLWEFTVQHRDLTAPLLGQWIAISGVSQLALVVIAGIADLRAVGSLRAAQTLLGPVNILAYAASGFAVPEMIRGGLTGKRLLRSAIVLTLVLFFGGLAWGTVLLVLPGSVGTALLGDTWVSARSVLPLMLLFTLLMNLGVGCTTIFRSRDVVRYAFATSSILGPMMLLLSVGGAVTAGARGAAAGFALAAGIMLVPTWLLAARASGTPNPRQGSRRGPSGLSIQPSGRRYT